MNSFTNNSQSITSRIHEIISSVSLEENEKAIAEILSAKSVFVFGAGRSGLVGRAFAMRLIHLGKIVHFVGDCTTPAITAEDILITISGSGKTSSVVQLAEAAKARNAKILAISSTTDSPLAEVADALVVIPIKKDSDDKGGNYLDRQLAPDEQFNKITPMGTLFELSVMIYFDSIVPVMMEKLGVSESHMKNNHANLE